MDSILHASWVKYIKIDRSKRLNFFNPEFLNMQGQNIPYCTIYVLSNIENHFRIFVLEVELRPIGNGCIIYHENLQILIVLIGNELKQFV